MRSTNSALTCLVLAFVISSIATSLGARPFGGDPKIIVSEEGGNHAAETKILFGWPADLAALGTGDQEIDLPFNCLELQIVDEIEILVDADDCK